MERSMALLRTNRIDLMQVHNLVDVNTQLATLREWKSGRAHSLHWDHALRIRRFERNRKTDADRED